ncbi:hypothetical protein [Frankia sp. CiP3]|uniref:hypothetical protein n=1 Tax=Frankia sp. CiP3 TaxID=2880971 RepID=UPI001EF4BDC4|nr:hypothetical protein [Frankia sp. CiP3]
MSAEPDRRGPLRRLRTWIGGTPEDRPEVAWIIVGEPVQTPSKGDAYDFEVTVRCAWHDGQRPVTEIRSRAADYESLVQEKIAVATRCVLRAYPPHQAAEAETCLNAQLDVLARQGLPETTLGWSARAEVTLHTDVRALQQQAWTRALQQDALHDFSQQLVSNYTEMATQWRRLLAMLGIDALDAELPPAPYLARHLLRLAAQPEHAADVVDQLAEQREAKDDELLTTVFQAVDNANNVNLLEFDVAHNSALVRLMQWAGLPVADWSSPSTPEGTR